MLLLVLLMSLVLMLMLLSPSPPLQGYRLDPETELWVLRPVFGHLPKEVGK